MSKRFTVTQRAKHMRLIDLHEKGRKIKGMTLKGYNENGYTVSEYERDRAFEIELRTIAMSNRC